ncbi:MAG: hypothetical protein M3680_23610 [Myxococcota bacterium]|nr:hypothetical protein [Myxococcota bacterium]
MTRLLLSLVLVAACGGKKSSTSTAPTGTGPATGSGTSSSTVMAKRISLSWGITPTGDLADVYLATTDETGKQVSHSVGRYKGNCAPFKPAAEMKAITGVVCTTTGGGTELHAVVQGGEEVIVLQLGTNPGVTPDPMARKEITRIKVPLGIGIEAAAH